MLELSWRGSCWSLHCRIGDCLSQLPTVHLQLVESEVYMYDYNILTLCLCCLLFLTMTIIVRPLQINYLFLIPLSPRIDTGGRHFWRVMVVKITSFTGNGRQNYKFNSSKNLLYCAGIICGRKSRGDEKQLIDLEWPNLYEPLQPLFKCGQSGYWIPLSWVQQAGESWRIFADFDHYDDN